MTWINASGAEMRPEDWDDGNMRCFGMLIDGRAQPTGIRQRGEDATLLMVLNAHHDVVEFTLPGDCGRQRMVAAGRHQPRPGQDPESFATGDSYAATGRSVLLFALCPDAAG